MDGMIEHVWPTIEILGQQLVTASVVGGAALALAWAVNRSVSRLSSGVRSWLWRLAFLKLLVAFAIIGVIEVPVLPGRPEVLAAAKSVSVESPALAKADAAPAPAPARPSWPLVLAAIWAAGVLYGGVRVMRGWARSRAIRAAAVPVPEGDLPQLVNGVARAMGLSDPPWVSTLPGADGPMLVGLFSPTVVLPEKIAGGAAEDVRMVVGHELAHFARNDLAWNLIPVLAEVLFWFHPLVWIAAREMTVDQEIAADELALAACGASLRSYGELLLGFVQVTPAPTPLVALHASGSGALLKRRLTVLARGAGRAIGTSRAGSAAVVLVAILAAAPLQPVRQQEDPITAPASMSVKDANFSDVAYTLAINAGFTVVMPTEIQNKTVTVNLRDIRALDALREIAKGIGVTVHRANFPSKTPIFILLPAGQTLAKPPITSNLGEGVSMAIKDASTLVVVETIVINSGLNFVAGRKATPDVTVRFEEFEVAAALNAIAAVTGVELIESRSSDGKITIALR